MHRKILKFWKWVFKLFSKQKDSYVVIYKGAYKNFCKLIFSGSFCKIWRVSSFQKFADFTVPTKYGSIKLDLESISLTVKHVHGRKNIL